MNWKLYPNFTANEFDCKHSGKNQMRPEFMELLQAIRSEYGKPLYITSGYRDITHPIEAAKEKGGTHSLGLACDIGIRGEEAIKLIGIAINRGVKRIGIQQKGLHRFVHLDIADKYGYPKSIWSY